MDQPLSIRRRQRLSCLLITLTLLLSLTKLTTCALVETAQGSLQSRQLPEESRVANNDYRTITNMKNRNVTDTSLYVNNTSWFEILTNNTKNVGQKSESNTPSEGHNEYPNSNLLNGLSFLKVFSSMKDYCMRRNDAFKCAFNSVIELMNDILKSPNSYASSNDGSINEVGNNDGSDMLDIKHLQEKGKNITALQEVFIKRLKKYKLTVSLPELADRVQDSARAAFSWFKPEGDGKSSFLTGFGLGFLAFALKKLLLPIFLGGQIIKSVLIAMFLPTILGGLGKLVGKGVSTFASSSGSSGPYNNNNVDDFELKDNMEDTSTADSKFSPVFAYPETYGTSTYQNSLAGLPAGTLPGGAIYFPATSTGSGSFNREQQTVANPKVSYASLPTGAQHHYGSYYTRHQQSNKKQDYKVFHNIPSSSLLLTNYDPFYSPLLSRLDSVFKQLGYETENCRERLVCAMYSNPAKFAPFSNLVSAQLSRELNELRKPSTDNPEILRFFRYMKAAKDGQDGKDCIRLHPGCTASSSNSNTHPPPMIKTYQDINKLVQARRLGKMMDLQENDDSRLTTEV